MVNGWKAGRNVMPPSPQWHFDPFRLDPGNARLWRGDRSVALTLKAFGVLHHLVTHAGQLVTKEALLDAVWPETAVSDAALRVVIRELRKALGDTAQAPQFIATVHRLGYRFLAPVTRIDPPAEGLETVPPFASVSPSLQASWPAEIHTVALPPMSVEADSPPLPVSQALQCVRQRMPLAAPLARPRSLFVGRDAELAVLYARLALVERSQGQVVGIVGEASIGKSRLLYEFRQGLGTRQVTYVQGRCQPDGRTMPYLPVLDLLRATLQITEANSAAAIVAKVYAGLRTRALAPDAWAPYLLPLLGIEVEPARFIGVDPEVLRARTFEALHQLIFSSGQQRPCILEVEDVHWIDATSEAYLAALAERLAGFPILLLVTFRPGYRPPWLDISSATQIALQRLGPDDSRQVVRALLHETPLPLALEQQLLAKAAGHPLFLEELAQAVAEQGSGQPVRPLPATVQAALVARLKRLPPVEKRILLTAAAISRRVVHALLRETPLPLALEQQLLAKAAGHPLFLEKLAQAVAEQGSGQPVCPVPATVQAALAARIDRLPPVEKRILQTAAVIGMEVPFALLNAIMPLPEETWHQSLTHLQTAEFLSTMRLTPERVYTFKHTLTQEAAYGSLFQTQRRTLHQRVVTALEACPSRRPAWVNQVAYHALRGELWDTAVTAFQQLGTAAMARSAYHEAVACYEQALEALRRLPSQPETHAQAIDLHLALRHALIPLGELARSFAHLDEAKTLALALGDTARQGFISAYLTRDLYSIGDYEGAVAAGQHALTMTQENFALQITTRLYLSYAYHALGEYQQALALLRPDIAALMGDWLYERFGLTVLPTVSARYSMVNALAELGNFDEGIALGQEALRIAETVGHSFSLYQSCRGLGGLYLRKGDLERAIPLLERGLVLSQDAHLLHGSPVVTSTLGTAYAQAGRLAEALPLLEQAVTQTAALRLVPDQALCLLFLSEGYLLAGRPYDALLRAQEALKLARAYKECSTHGYALRLLGMLAAQDEAPTGEPAEALYRSAMVLADAHGMRPLLAHSHLGLGLLYDRQGKRDQARTALSAAIDLFRAMDMVFWLSRAQEAIARVA
jgi:DNA-binding winged helix-turn-helix (wHTH) protein/tetratricopeptide (TPR) repeat protein